MIETPRETVDTTLLERIAQRDAAALSELYDRAASSLYGLIARILRDEHEAEDVLQEVFLRVWQKAESFDRSLGSPLVWLARIAHNLSIDRLRSRAMRKRDLEESFAVELANNQAQGYATLLMKVQPGTVYPEHEHTGPEDCYVLEGDLHVGSRVLGPGDFHHAESGTHHGIQSTENGCTLLLVVAASDYLSS